MAELLYQKTGGAPGAEAGAAHGTNGATNGEAAPEGDVIDAEFKEAK